MGFFYVLKSLLNYSLYFGSTDNIKKDLKSIMAEKASIQKTSCPGY